MHQVHPIELSVGESTRTAAAAVGAAVGEVVVDCCDFLEIVESGKLLREEFAAAAQLLYTETLLLCCFGDTGPVSWSGS